MQWPTLQRVSLVRGRDARAAKSESAIVRGSGWRERFHAVKFGSGSLAASDDIGSSALWLTAPPLCCC
eukprot:177356-Prymnesium_polylepis.1